MQIKNVLSAKKSKELFCYIVAQTSQLKRAMDLENSINEDEQLHDNTHLTLEDRKIIRAGIELLAEPRLFEGTANRGLFQTTLNGVVFSCSLT